MSHYIIIFSFLGFSFFFFVFFFFTISIILSHPHLLSRFLALLFLLFFPLYFGFFVPLPFFSSYYYFLNLFITGYFHLNSFHIAIVSFLNVLLLPPHLKIFFAHLLSFICSNLTLYLIFCLICSLFKCRLLHPISPLNASIATCLFAPSPLLATLF